VIFENGSVHHQDRHTDPFMQAYLKYNLTIRPACHTCRYKEDYRNVDLSLGDFWGVSNYSADLDNNKGTSVAIANTEKGVFAVESLSDQISIHLMKIEQVEAGNVCLRKPAIVGSNRDNFLKNLDRLGFDKAMKKYARNSLHMKLTRLSLRVKGRIEKILS